MKNKNPSVIIIYMMVILFGLYATVFSQTGSRVGTTAASFLELSFDAVGNGIGEAQVCTGYNLASIYFNPANLGNLEHNEVQATYLPWILDINSSYIGAGFVAPEIGTFGISFFQTTFGEESVTSVSRQEGTGEIFDGQDLYVMASFARNITNSFVFGASVKYVNSRIWHETASAFAVDLGAIVNTNFFSWTGKPGDGLNIGMSISNYGNRMQYDGMNLLNPIDINPNEHGNYGRVEGAFKLREWELPLLFRVGITATPIVTENTKLRIAIDALHPNNNSESLNVGAIYFWNIDTFGEIYLCAGYKGILMVESQYGLSVGGGITKDIFNNFKIVLDYAYQDLGTLGYANSFGLGIQF